jgi:hypothetical protein
MRDELTRRGGTTVEQYWYGNTRENGITGFFFGVRFIRSSIGAFIF